MDAVLASAPISTAHVNTSSTGDPDMDAVLHEAAQPSPSAMDRIRSDVVNPLVRAGAKAAWALPGMAMDFGVGVRNVIEGKDAKGNYPYELPSTTVNRALDQYFPPPTTGVGKASELANTMIMGAGIGAPTMGNKVPANFVSPNAAAPSGLSEAQQSAMESGKELGMKMTPGQETGSRMLQQLEARAQSIPAMSGPFNKVGANNAAVLGKTAAAGIGESGTAVDSNVLGRAADRIGDVFESARNPNSIIMTDPKTTSTVLDAIDADKAGLLPGTGSIRDNKLVQNFEELAKSGSMTGEQIGNLSSKLGKAAYKQMTSAMGDRDMGEALYQVKSHADDILQSTLSGEDQTAYAAARSQYHTLMQLAKPGVVNPSTGTVSGTH